MIASPPAPRRFHHALKTLCEGMISPTFFDFWAMHLNPLWTWEQPLAKVVARQALASDAVMLTLKANRHCRLPEPGQHLMLGVEMDGRRVLRSYSPSLLPGRRFSISVKSQPEGRLSQQLCQRTQVGDIVLVGEPLDGMSTTSAPSANWLFLAAGSGITPLISQLRALSRKNMPSVTLLYWAQREADLWFAEELRQLAQQCPTLRVRFFVTRDTPRNDDVSTGRLSAALLQDVCADLDPEGVQACGPEGFVEMARQAVPATVTTFLSESFSPLSRRVSDETGVASVTLQRRGIRVSVPRNEVLLSALEAAGLALPSGCRRGICKQCACGKPQGQTQNVLTGCIESDPTSGLQLCIHRAESDLILDL